MRSTGNKCAPYRDKLRRVRKNCNNIRSINSGFVSCEVDYIVIFLSGKLLSLHIKKKYRLLYIQKATAQRHLFPLWCVTLFSIRWCKTPGRIWSSELILCDRVMFNLRPCLLLCITAGYTAFLCCLKKQRDAWKMTFQDCNGVIHSVTHVKATVAPAQTWIIYIFFTHL